MKKLLLTPIIIALVSVFTISNAGVKHLSLNAAKQFADTSGQIPITAWVGIPPAVATPARFKELREAGITQSYYPYSNVNQVQTALDAAQQSGVKLLISCPELLRDPETVVKRFMNHPALAGYFLRDEPGRNAFAGLASLVNRIKAIDNNHICYVNLLPTYGGSGNFGVGSYQEYLDTYVNEVPVQILSFDHYPIVGSGRQSVRNDWYRNLEMISAISKRTGKPFWAFALTVAFDPYPDPTLASLRLQVYTDLAYGAQGIEYFTYWTPSDGGKTNFHNAPVGRDGSRSAVYDEIKQLNTEIKGLSGVFLGAKMVSVANTGSNIPAGTKPLGQLPKGTSVLKTSGMGALVSVLKKNNESYLVIVNRDFVGGMTLTIKCNAGVSRISKDGSATPQDQNINSVKIEPGDVAIYKWSD